VADLLDTEKSLLKGVPTIDDQLNIDFGGFGNIATVDPKLRLNPAKGHFDITADWGRGGSGQAVMPLRGRTGARTVAEMKTIARFMGHFRACCDEAGVTEDEGFALLGGEFVDVFLNDQVYWTLVPRAVWDFHIGGYQVLKKWLSYRDRQVTGRGLTAAEVEHFTHVVRRLTALVMLGPKLDSNYRAVKANAYTWPK